MHYFKALFITLCILFTCCKQKPDKYADVKKSIDSVVQAGKNQQQRSSYGSGDKNEFLKFVKTNKLVIDAAITIDNTLNLSVKNDGENKDGIAIYYCMSAKNKQVEIRQVKVLDAVDAVFGKDTVSGSVIGTSFCN